MHVGEEGLSLDGRPAMIDEILFMQLRLFRLFCERSNLSPREGNALWQEHDIWSFIESCYDILHLSGDDPALDDISRKLASEGFAI